MTSIIKVDQIQNAAGTSAISINSAGVVTRPQIPAFHVRSPSGTIATGQKPTWSNVTLNEMSFWNSSNNRAECTIAGLYHFTCSLGVYGQGNNVGRDIQHTFYLNGSGYGNGVSNQISNVTSSNDHTTATNTAMIRLDVGDYVEIRHNYVDGVAVYGGSAFIGYLIG